MNSDGDVRQVLFDRVCIDHIYMLAMAQFNLNMTPEFSKELELYMFKKQIHHKSEALRQAVHEALKQTNQVSHPDYVSWVGCALDKRATAPRFKTEDELWES